MSKSLESQNLVGFLKYFVQIIHKRHGTCAGARLTTDFQTHTSHIKVPAFFTKKVYLAVNVKLLGADVLIFNSLAEHKGGHIIAIF